MHRIFCNVQARMRRQAGRLLFSRVVTGYPGLGYVNINIPPGVGLLKSWNLPLEACRARRWNNIIHIARSKKSIKYCPFWQCSGAWYTFWHTLDAARALLAAIPTVLLYFSTLK
nr:MAG TPA: hypothetical protein [Caudoviricetes sp.]